MVTRKEQRPHPRLRFSIVIIFTMLLVGVGAVAGSVFAGAPTGLPSGKATAPAPSNQAAKGAQGARSAPVSNTGPDQPSQCGPGSYYIFTQSSGTFVLGQTDTGNHCDD